MYRGFGNVQESKGTIKFAAATVALTLVCVLALGAAAALAADKVTFRLNWIPEGEGEHAIFYVAHDLGYYAEQGLEVEIQRGAGSADTATRVAAGAVDIGYADTVTVAINRANGAPLKLIAMVFQNSPFTVWSRTDTGIRSPKDLEGKTIGAPAGDAQRVAFPAFAQATGIDASKVTWVTISPAAKITSLAAGRIDATVHFIDQRALYHDALGGPEKTVIFYWPDFGINPYGNGIFVTEQTLAAKPDVLRRFLEATFKAWRWTVLHPDEAIAIVHKYVPAVNEPLVLSMLREEIELMKSPEMYTRGLGWIEPSRMQETIGLVNRYFSLPRQVTAAEMYTNDLLPRYTWPYPHEFGE